MSFALAGNLTGNSVRIATLPAGRALYVGFFVGLLVGAYDVGAQVFFLVGLLVVALVGFLVGALVVALVGFLVVGALVGALVTRFAAHHTGVRRISVID